LALQCRNRRLVRGNPLLQRRQSALHGFAATLPLAMPASAGDPMATATANEPNRPMNRFMNAPPIGGIRSISACDSGLSYVNLIISIKNIFTNRVVKRRTNRDRSV
jgi:hypothetical protein